MSVVRTSERGNVVFGNDTSSKLGGREFKVSIQQQKENNFPWLYAVGVKPYIAYAASIHSKHCKGEKIPANPHKYIMDAMKEEYKKRGFDSRILPVLYPRMQ